MKNKYRSIFAVHMYIFIFVVHLFFCSFLWSLGFRNIFSGKNVHLYFLFFNFFSFFCFFLFLDYFAFFKVSVIVCWIVQMKCLVFARRAKNFETFFSVSSVCLIVSVLFSISSVVFVCICFNFVS